MKTKTPKQVKEDFRKRGQTFSDWARKNGFDPHKVIRVLNGYAKGNWGEVHQIAVALGIK